MTDRLRRIYDDFTGAACGFGRRADELGFSSGVESARVILVGEAPGKDEVREGRPFVGKAGRNLDEFLALSGIERETLFITNVVKFRPYKVSAKGTVSNRPPTGEEIALCRECLLSEIALVAPVLIVTLGNTALHAVVGKDTMIGQVHGVKLISPGIGEVYPLYHPASVIYRPELKTVYRQDVVRLKELL